MNIAIGPLRTWQRRFDRIRGVSRGALYGFGLGAVAEYFVDPREGRRRRARVARPFRWASRTVSRVAGPRGGEALDRARVGVWQAAEALSSLEHDRARDGSWSPLARAATSGIGGALAGYGFVQGGLAGALAAGTGTAMIARSVVNRSLVPFGARPELDDAAKADMQENLARAALTSA